MNKSATAFLSALAVLSPSLAHATALVCQQLAICAVQSGGTTSLVLPPGTAPTSPPPNGYFWSTPLGFYGQVAGATVGPFGTGGGKGGFTTYINAAASPYNASPSASCSANASAITAADTAAAALTPKGVVYLPQGNYSSNAFTITSSGFVGDSRIATNLTPCQATSTFITLSGQNDKDVGQFGIINSIPLTAGDAIYVNTGGVWLHDILAYGVGSNTFYNILHLDATNAVNYLLDDLNLIGASNNGIQSGDSSSTSNNVEGNANNIYINANVGILLYTNGGSLWNNIQTLEGTHGIQTYPGSGQIVFAQYFNNVFADTTTGDAWSIVTNGGDIGDMHFNNIWGSSSTGSGAAGMRLQGATSAGVDGVTIANSSFVNNNGPGLSIAAAKNITVSNSQFCNNSVAGSGDYPGISVAAGISYFNILDDTGGDCGKLEQQSVASNQSYLVVVGTGASDYYDIIGVTGEGNVSGLVSDGGSGAHKQVIYPGSPGATITTTQVGTGAVSRTQVNKNNDILNVTDYGAVAATSAACTGVNLSQNTLAIQAAINAALAAGSIGSPAHLYFGPGWWCANSGTLSIGTTGYVEIEGSPGTFWIDGSATGDFLTIGASGGAVTDGVVLRNLTFGMKTGVTPTAGSMVKALNTSNIYFDTVSVGDTAWGFPASSGGSAPPNAYDAFTFIGFQYDVMNHVNVWNVADVPLTVAGSAQIRSEFHVEGGSQFNYSSGVGIHLAGGVGGFYYDSASQATSLTYGMYIDEAIYAGQNPQVFIGPAGILDSNEAGDIYIGDSVTPQTACADGSTGVICSALGDFFMKGWAGSAGNWPTHGAASSDGILTSVNQHGLVALVDGAHFENDNNMGIAALGGRWIIGGASRFWNNGGSGVYVGSGNLSMFVDDSFFFLNGRYGVEDAGPAGLTLIGSNSYQSDTLGNYVTVNGLGSLTIPSFSGGGGGSYVPLSGTSSMTGTITGNSSFKLAVAGCTVTGYFFCTQAPNGVYANSATQSSFTFIDTNTSGQTWSIGPGSGTGTITDFNIYSVTNTLVLAHFSNGGNLTVPGQLVSTVSTGTAPLAVSSTTNVANLNASSLNGATFASPGPIGSTTASTGTFTTEKDTTLAVGGCGITGYNFCTNAPNGLYVNSSAQSAITFIDSNTSGQTTAFGPGAGSGSAAEVNLYDLTTSAFMLRVSKTGILTAPGTATGTNADFACIGTGGILQLQSTACTISSLRYKIVDGTVSDSDLLADAMGLKPTAFHMKPRTAMDDRPMTMTGGELKPNPTFGQAIPYVDPDKNRQVPQIGLIAEDVAAVDKRCAVYDDDMTTPKSYRETCILAILIGAVHELKAANDDMRAEITALKAK